jgi:peptidoglycan hydrolase-like protein with peptidoglycan-binding domain
VAFQKRYGLQPDGIVGPKTRQALFPLVTFTNYLGVGLFPVNISFDINDRLSIIGQLGVVGTYDLANKRVEAGAQPAIFGTWSF